MKKSELTQKRIIEAAEFLFGQKNIDQVPVSEIVKHAKVAKGTFYLYFETKEDVVWAVIEKYLHHFTEIFNHLDLKQVSFQSIDDMIDALFAFILSHKREMHLFHQASFLGYLGEERIEKKYLHIWKAPILSWIQKGVDQKVFHVHHVDFTSEFILASFHGMIDDFIVGQSKFSADLIQVELKTIVRKLLG